MKKPTPRQRLVARAASRVQPKTIDSIVTPAFNRRYPLVLMAYAVRLYLQGSYSTRDIQDHLSGLGLSISWKTVFFWIRDLGAGVKMTLESRERGISEALCQHMDTRPGLTKVLTTVNGDPALLYVRFDERRLPVEIKVRQLSA